MNHLKLFENFDSSKKLNESGRSSIWEGGFVKINGVKFPLQHHLAIDTPDFVAYDVGIKLDAETMIKAGIWSDIILTEYYEYPGLIFAGTKTIPGGRLERDYDGSVANMDDIDLVDEFPRANNAIEREYTSKEFVRIAKKLAKEYNSEDISDLRVLTPEQIAEKKIEMKNMATMKEISSILTGLTPKEVMSIIKRKNLPEAKIAKLEKLTKKKGEDLLNYIEDAVENNIE